MIYTGFHSHMSQVYVQKGAIVKTGEKIGRLGATGISTGKHNHFALLPGKLTKLFRMSYALSIIAAMEEKDLVALFEQFHYFVDYQMFGISKEDFENGIDIKITSGFGEPNYTEPWKVHTGFDVTPNDRFVTTIHHDIIHNRSKPITVVQVGEDAGYGKYVLFWFEA